MRDNRDIESGERYYACLILLYECGWCVIQYCLLVHWYSILLQYGRIVCGGMLHHAQYVLQYHVSWCCTVCVRAGMIFCYYGGWRVCVLV